jgi:hypothetical protein
MSWLMMPSLTPPMGPFLMWTLLKCKLQLLCLTGLWTLALTMKDVLLHMLQHDEHLAGWDLWVA